MNSSQLTDCDLCRIKILVSDGINTNYTITNQTFEIDNDLQIKEFNVVYQNDTERIFGFDIKNSFSSSALNNISWSLDTGENIINSTYQINLTSLENALIFVYHNYAKAGNYTLTSTAFNDKFTERRSINIII